MTRLARIESHIASMRELREIVGAVRSLAGMRTQEALHCLPGIRRYADTAIRSIADTLASPLGDIPRSDPRAGLCGIVCMCEHGFVGGFNERLIEAARSAFAAGTLLIVGSRGAALAAERWRPADWTLPMPPRCAAATDAADRLSAELYRRIADGEVARVELLYARHQPNAAAGIAHRQLLPFDPSWAGPGTTRQRPLFNLEPAMLQEKLIAEYVFAVLTEALVESIAGENAARLAAMASAHDSVSQKLERLAQDARQARQSEITEEILELVTGTRALDS